MKILAASLSINLVLFVAGALTMTALCAMLALSVGVVSFRRLN